MRKRARRLWLGDWQREQPDQVDTFVATPEDAPDEVPIQPRRDNRRAAAALAGIALLFILGFAISSGGNNAPPVSQQTPPPQVFQNPPQIPQGGPQQGFGGPDLTGAEATQAAQAALRKYGPGDIERVTRGPSGGGYVVHVIQPDGNEVHVIVDDDFNVQGSDANSGPRGFGQGTNQ